MYRTKLVIDDEMFYNKYEFERRIFMEKTVMNTICSSFNSFFESEKKIVVKGFHHLKISLAKEVINSNKSNVKVTNHISIDDISQSFQNILANKVEELKQIVLMIDNKQLIDNLNIIQKDKSVQFVAVGNTIPRHENAIAGG